MNLIQVSKDRNDYLAWSGYSDFRDPLVAEKCGSLFRGCSGKTEIVRKAYYFVRDDILHSWDIQNRQVNITSHEVLVNRHGICHAKANLLAAMLRFMKVPTGFCYQRLTIWDTPDTGFCLHVIPAVYLSGIGWIRMDTRGNKPGVNAQFFTDHEQLAFPIRENYTEKDYPYIFARPLPSVIRAMQSYTDCLDLYLHGLPVEIPEDEIPIIE